MLWKTRYSVNYSHHAGTYLLFLFVHHLSGMTYRFTDILAHSNTCISTLFQILTIQQGLSRGVSSVGNPWQQLTGFKLGESWRVIIHPQKDVDKRWIEQSLLRVCSAAVQVNEKSKRLNAEIARFPSLYPQNFGRVYSITPNFRVHFIFAQILYKFAKIYCSRKWAFFFRSFSMQKSWKLSTQEFPSIVNCGKLNLAKV